MERGFRGEVKGRSLRVNMSETQLRILWDNPTAHDMNGSPTDVRAGICRGGVHPAANWLVRNAGQFARDGSADAILRPARGLERTACTVT